MENQWFLHVGGESDGYGYVSAGNGKGKGLAPIWRLTTQ